MAELGIQGFREIFIGIGHSPDLIRTVQESFAQNGYYGPEIREAFKRAGLDPKNATSRYKREVLADFDRALASLFGTAADAKASDAALAKVVLSAAELSLDSESPYLSARLVARLSPESLFATNMNSVLGRTPIFGIHPDELRDRIADFAKGGVRKQHYASGGQLGWVRDTFKTAVAAFGLNENQVISSVSLQSAKEEMFVPEARRNERVSLRAKAVKRVTEVISDLYKNVAYMARFLPARPKMMFRMPRFPELSPS